MAFVYIHMKPSTRDIYYVGIATDPKRPYRRTKRNSYWTRVYNKYGLLVDIVAKDISLEEAKEMEKFLIDSIGIDNLCNITLGGEGAFGYKPSEENRKRHSEIMKGRPSPRKGCKHTPESLKKMSESHKGWKMSDDQKRRLIEYLTGRKHSEETKRKISETRKERGIQISEITRQRQKEAWRESSMRVRELTTGIECYMWETPEIFNASYRTVNGNSNHERPIANGKSKGLNFIRI